MLARRVKQMTGFVPARLPIFKLAFSHKSNQATKDSGQTNNERLEYLGDAVLGTVVAEYLFKKYPNADEGFLTKMRSKIVKRKSLNYIGDAMGLDVLLSEYNRTRLSPSMLGNAVEALVGAVYLEKGYQPTKRFIIQRMLKLYVDMHELETVDDNYKSQLLEYCQKNGKTIVYKLVKKYKHDRRDRFQVAVVIGNESIATANDYNKKAAEQLASLKALEKMGVVETQSAEALRQFSSKGEKPNSNSKNKPSRIQNSSDDEPEASQSYSDKKVNLEDSSAQRPAKKAITEPPKRVDHTSQEHSKKKPEVQPEEKREESQPSQAKTSQTQQAKQSKYVMPPKKQARNNSFLGRCIWHGTATGNASIGIVDSLFYKIENETKLQPENSKQQVLDDKSSGGMTTTDAQVSAPSSIASQIKPSKVQPTKKKVTKAVSKPKRTFETRKKTLGLPIRVLTPIISDIGASLSIEVGGYRNPIVLESSLKRLPSSENSVKKTGTSQVEIAKNQRVTPIITGENRSLSEEVVVEKIENWENTLLEVSETPPPKTATKPRPSRRRASKPSRSTKD